MWAILTRRRVIAALTVVASLAVAGAAFAYFDAPGQGSGTATVGSGATWKVTSQAPTGGPMYPGGPSESITYTVTNTGSGNELFHGFQVGLRPGLDSSGNAVVTQNGGHPVQFCLASWFTMTDSPPESQDLAPGATATGTLTISMIDASTSQDACQGVSPELTINPV